MAGKKKIKVEYAQARRDRGESLESIAKSYGVSRQAVARVTTGSRRPRKPTLCVDCGAECQGSSRCLACHRALTVRGEALRCNKCGEWKADEAFSRNASHAHRRGRAKDCRQCHNGPKPHKPFGWLERRPDDMLV